MYFVRLLAVVLLITRVVVLVRGLVVELVSGVVALYLSATSRRLSVNWLIPIESGDSCKLTITTFNIESYTVSATSMYPFRTARSMMNVRLEYRRLSTSHSHPPLPPPPPHSLDTNLVK